MNATVYHRPTGVLLLLIATTMAAIAIMALSYGSIPLSHHARTGHQGETWNTASITEYFDTGKCQPTEYMCPNSYNRIAYCEIKPGLSIGLIIGFTKIIESIREDIIVTGFASSTDYWKPGGDVCR